MKVLYNGKSLITLKSFENGILNVDFQNLLLKISFGSTGKMQSEVNEQQFKLLKQYFTISQ